jgi:cyclopropane-fatty-acyl-phospholipid synthase
MSRLIDWCERGYIPDALVRAGMRWLIGTRLGGSARSPAARSQALRQLLAMLRRSPIAIATAMANAQHYALPPEFFRLHLGPRLKYSCCWFGPGIEGLAAAEEATLELYAERAQLADGQRILDLGCGWGSATLWMAERYPRARITALSNSSAQRHYIEGELRRRGLGNVSVVTGDIADFDFTDKAAEASFDRIISVEMLEHLRNYGLLFAKLRSWLKADGRVFIHVFAHPTLAYPFETEGPGNWMGRYFFTGGLMPSESLFLHFQDDLQVLEQWWMDGSHYARTAEEWLKRLDAVRAPVLRLFAETYGAPDAARWLQRWRMFYQAVAELFGYRRGHEWGGAHYLLAPRSARHEA